MEELKLITSFPKNIIYLILSIAFIILLASLLHFAYKFSKDSTFVGILTPVNESIWEHLKLAMYPTTLWYIIYFLIFKNNHSLDIKSLFAQCTCSILISIIIVVTFYYTYTGALGIHSLILDILSLVLGTSLGQTFSFIYFSKHAVTNINIYIALYVIMAVLFTLFTFIPPKLPIFLDPETKTYGIKSI